MRSKEKRGKNKVLWGFIYAAKAFTGANPEISNNSLYQDVRISE